MNEPVYTVYTVYFEPVASSFYDGATGNRCFKLETITSDRREASRAPSALPLSYVVIYSRGKRGWIIECTAALAIISPLL